MTGLWDVIFRLKGSDGHVSNAHPRGVQASGAGPRKGLIYCPIIVIMLTKVRIG